VGIRQAFQITADQQVQVFIQALEELNLAWRAQPAIEHFQHLLCKSSEHGVSVGVSATGSPARLLTPAHGRSVDTVVASGFGCDAANQ